MKVVTLIINLVFATLIFGQNNYEEAMKNCISLGYLESQKCMEGEMIPSFEGITYNDEKLTSESIKNKVAVINFWFIACPPCIAELGGLNRTVEKYKERDDIIFISFTTDNKETLEEEFFPNYNLDFEIIQNSQDMILEVFKIWWGYPTTIIIDKSGKIHRITSGGKSDAEEASKEIEEMLSKSIDECLKK